MNDRIIRTGCYTKIARDILESVIGQLSDGIWENSPAMEKWWRFANIDTAPDGEVLICVGSQSSETEHRWLGDRYRYIENGFYGLTDDEIKTKFAKFIKKIVQLELEDAGMKGEWKRANTHRSVGYLSREIPVFVSHTYVVYEKLLSRPRLLDKYDHIQIEQAIGYARSAEETAAEERARAETKARILAGALKAVDDWETAEIDRIRREANSRRNALHNKCA